MTIRRVGVITNPHFKDTRLVDRTLSLLSHHFTVVAEPITSQTEGVGQVSIADMNVDLAVIFGGDGTLLWAVNQLPKNPLILGVNTGRVGYLTEIQPEETTKAIKKIVRGAYTIEARTKLEVNNTLEALNEVAITPEDPTTLLELSINLDGRLLSEFRADGVLVATPTGSTGYSLSVGGPVVHPTTSAFVIAPINPLKKDPPPIIVPDTSTLTISLKRERRNAHLVLDGRVESQLKQNDTITVGKCDRKVRFLRL